MVKEKPKNLDLRIFAVELHIERLYLKPNSKKLGKNSKTEKKKISLDNPNLV